jgi:hypothetical protein
MAKKTKDQKRKTRKGKKPKAQNNRCSFVVKVADLNACLGRIHGLMNVDGIPVQDQFVAFRTDLEDGKLVLQAGRQGTYVEVRCPAEISAKGSFVTNIAIPWLTYGSATVSMVYDPSEKNVKFKGSISGSFATTGKLNEILENKVPLRKPVLIPFAKLSAVVSTVLFNADVLDDHEDVLVLLGITKLAKPVKTKSAKIKRKGEKAETTEVGFALRATVFDRTRAAIMERTCAASSEMPVGSFGSGHLFTFIQKCVGEERKRPIKMSITEDFIGLDTGECLSITPALDNALGDATDDLYSINDKDALFSFTLSTDDHVDPFVNVLSVQGGPRAKLATGSDETAAHVEMILDKKGKVTLTVKGNVATGKTTFNSEDAQGSGRIVIKGTHIVEAMSLVNPAKVRVTVWRNIVRQSVIGHALTDHWFGTVDEL